MPPAEKGSSQRDFTMTTQTMTRLAADNDQKDASIVAACRVLDQEIEGLQALKSSLGKEFLQAVGLLSAAKGRVVLSGMGKSGHVARKIAATLASTGTPALFVHPGEASHGDLGMITRDDVVMLLSNSGETAELQDIIDFTRRFSIPLIGMVRRKTSVLVDSADVALVLPATPEASPIGAPTTSTTMMLALGDALAVALLEKRGFNKDDFHVFHPGGKLGAALLKIKDLMHTGASLPLVRPDIAMSEVLIEITQKSMGCAAVVDGKGILLGIITDGDLRRHMSPSLTSQRAEEVMTKSPKVVAPDMLASQALNIMNEKKITNLFVVGEGNKVVGILHIHDCLRAGVV